MKEELWNGGGKFGVGERGGIFGVGEKGEFFHGDRVVPLEVKSWCQKFHHMMKSFFSKVLFFGYKVLLETYKVFNIFSKVLIEVRLIFLST